MNTGNFTDVTTLCTTKQKKKKLLLLRIVKGGCNKR